MPRRGPYFRPLADHEIRHSLVDDLVGIADDLRDIHEEFGNRPYRTRLVWERWTPDVDGDRLVSGEETFLERARGVGRVELVHEIVLVPVPAVSFGLMEDLDAVGRTERGTATVTELSLTYPEELLMGLLPDHPELRDRERSDVLARDVTFFWEIQERRPARYRMPGDLDRSRTTERAAARRRFIVSGTPRRETFGWVVNLTRAEGDRGPAGEV